MAKEKPAQLSTNTAIIVDMTSEYIGYISGDINIQMTTENFKEYIASCIKKLFMIDIEFDKVVNAERSTKDVILTVRNTDWDKEYFSIPSYFEFGIRITNSKIAMIIFGIMGRNEDANQYAELCKESIDKDDYSPQELLGYIIWQSTNQMLKQNPGSGDPYEVADIVLGNY
jgi:hypothetical protein